MDYPGYDNLASKNTGNEPEVMYDIPDNYGDHKIVLMVRDPWTLFAYWELDQSAQDSIVEEVKSRNLNITKKVLRVYKIDPETQETVGVFTDYEVQDWLDRWYVHTNDPGTAWVMDLGYVCDNGEFFKILRSNAVEAPRYGMADETSSNWMCTEEEYYSMFAASGGYGIGMSSMEMREIVERHLKSWLTSGGRENKGFGSLHIFGSMSLFGSNNLMDN